MFFLPHPDQLNTWETNWEIRVSWPGELFNKAQKKTLPPYDYQLKQSIEELKASTEKMTEWGKKRLKWYIQRSSNDGDFSHLPNQQHYFEPYFLLSFYPQESLTDGKVLKLYSGFRFLHALWKFDSFKMVQYLARMKINWGVTINDQFKKGCAINWTSEPDSRWWKPIPKGYDYFIRPSEVYLRGLHLYKKANLLRKKPLLIPFNCLKKGQQNTIKVWWSVNEKFDDVFAPNLMNIKIDFYYPQTTNLALVLKEGEQTDILLHQWYLITTELGKKSKITPIQHQKLTFESNLDKIYANNQPFQSLWTIGHHPIQMSETNGKLLIDHFQYKHLVNDFTKVINWSLYLPEDKVVTEIINGNQKHLLNSLNSLVDKATLSIPLRTYDYYKEFPIIKELKYYKYLFRNFLQTKNSWDPTQNKFIINPLSKYSFFATSHNHHNNINLFTKFLWKHIVNINFLINQKLIINNQFLHQQLQLTSAQTATANKQKQQVIFNLNSWLLKEMINLGFDFAKYQNIKNQYSRHNVEKNR